jgi:hypothetical protein
VGTLIHYPVPVHRQPAYQNRVGVGSRGLQETENVVQGDFKLTNVSAND